MRTSDCDILIVPGWSGSGPDHWQTRWEGKLSTARRVEQDDWYKPTAEGWTGRLIAEAAMSQRPLVLVAHSLGIAAVLHAAPALTHNVRGAFLVAPPSTRAVRAIPGVDPAFAPLPRARLPFRATLIASRDDPYCPFEEAAELAGAIGAELVDAGASGHINAASGHGPWPEGLMRFASFLRPL